MWTRGAGGSGIGLKKWARLSTGFIHGSLVTCRLRERVSGRFVGSRGLGERVIGEVVGPRSRRCMGVGVSRHLSHWSWLSKRVHLRVMLSHSRRTGEVVISAWSRGMRRLSIGVIELILGEPVGRIWARSVEGILSLRRGHRGFEQRD